jgi:hypothetical protein
MPCIRCGREESLEKSPYHIVMRSLGGGDEPENKEERCEPCHKYEHTRRRLESSLAAEQRVSG